MAPLFSWRPLTHSLAILLGVALLAIPLACDSPDAASKKASSDDSTEGDQQADTKTDVEDSSESDTTPPTNNNAGDSTSPQPGSTDSGPPVNPFEIPEKGAEELFAFISRVQQAPLSPLPNENPKETEERFVEHNKKIMDTIIQATQRVRAGEATDEEYAKAMSFEHQALSHLSSMGDEVAAQQAKQLLEDSKGDDRHHVLQVVITGLFELAGQGDQAALKSAAEVLDRISKDDRPEILGLRLDSLFHLDSLGDQTAMKTLEELLAQLKKDQRPEVVELAQRNAIRLSSQHWDQLSDEAKKKLMDDFQNVLSSGEFGNDQLNFGLAVAEGIELSGDGPAALESYQVLTETMAGSGNQMLAMLAQQIAVMSGSLQWLGKDFEISGTLMDGTPFNPKKYEGKLVLVDFWATWCGPCIQELPNVLAAYEKYHESGFEVVGVSLDSEPEALEAFVEARKIPWANIFGKDASERGYEHPMALRYQIEGIPATFLLDGQGKVIAVNLRGQKLDKVLRQRMGATKPVAGKPVTEGKPEEAEKAPSPEPKPSDEKVEKKAEVPKAEDPAKDSPQKKESGETSPNDAQSKTNTQEESKKE